MDKNLYDNYCAILKGELLPAMGCTEPIAVAYAAARARAVLGVMPQKVKVCCSGNIIKNVKGVIVPNSGGMKGIDTAAVLGVVGGREESGLEVLNHVSAEDIARTKELVESGYCDCSLAEGRENLYIFVEVSAGSETALVEIKTKHNHISRIEKNKEVVFSQEDLETSVTGDKAALNLKDILSFADFVEIGDVKEVLDRQIQYNSDISREGLLHSWGAGVGKTLLETYGAESVDVRAKAAAAAGSDARMSGCALPVVINSGSGNQGMTVSLPIIEYAKELNSSPDLLYRALVVGNLVSIHQKRFIGNLSAYCGAVSAGCGAACGIAYLQGAGYEVIADTITNAIANVGGMVCDGAKPSCAAKIASAVDAGLLGLYMAKKGNAFQGGEGLVADDVEQTIRNLGRMGKEGMKSTDMEILNIMLGNYPPPGGIYMNLELQGKTAVEEELY